MAFYSLETFFLNCDRSFGQPLTFFEILKSPTPPQIQRTLNLPQLNNLVRRESSCVAFLPKYRQIGLDCCQSVASPDSFDDPLRSSLDSAHRARRTWPRNVVTADGGGSSPTCQVTAVPLAQSGRAEAPERRSAVVVFLREILSLDHPPAPRTPQKVDLHTPHLTPPVDDGRRAHVPDLMVTPRRRRR